MPPEELMELPENVVVLEIPNELKLDPIAVAPEYGSDLLELYSAVLNIIKADWVCKMNCVSII